MAANTWNVILSTKLLHRPSAQTENENQFAGHVLPSLRQRPKPRRTLIGSNTRSGSDSQTVSTAPRRGRPRPEVRPLNWMPARFTGFHPLWWAAGHLGQPGKPGLQGGDGGGG